MAIENLIEALSDPRAFPRPAERVEVRQTHISVLFFAGAFVYKVKKPVSLGFLDFSTAERRLGFCREEVRVNAALAPGVYVGVAPILGDGTGRLRIGEVYAAGEGPDVAAVDHAVVMHRLPEERMLERLLDRGEVDNAVIDALVGTLAGFHGAAETGGEVDEHGHPEMVAERVGRNLAECERFCGDDAGGPATVPARLLGRVRRFAQGFIAEHRQLLQRRVLDGRIRDGHGDLHAGNICVLPGRVVIYDRIEFARALRCADVASEVGFLAMDLDVRGYRGFAGYLAARYAQRTADSELTTLLPLYKTHLAMVRGKVASIRSREEGFDDADRAVARAEARRYFNLAASYTLGPALILMCGLPGTGKSSAARAIAEPFEGVILRSDVLRKHLARLAPTARSRGPLDAGLYAPGLTERTYRELVGLAEGHLAAGRTVIVDATFRGAAQRGMFFEAAERLGVPALVAHITCPEEVVEERLARRGEDAEEVSDADVRVYRHLRGSFEAPDEVAAERRVELTCLMEGAEIAAAVVDRLVGLAG